MLSLSGSKSLADHEVSLCWTWQSVNVHNSPPLNPARGWFNPIHISPGLSTVYSLVFVQWIIKLRLNTVSKLTRMNNFFSSQLKRMYVCTRTYMGYIL